MDTTKEGSENAELKLKQQILQAILQHEVANPVEANTHLTNPHSTKDLGQLNLELINAENKHREKKTKNKYRQLLFLYPHNKMSQEEVKRGLLRDLQEKYQIKVEQMKNLHEHIQKVQKELQRAGNEVEALRASVKANEEEDKFKGKVNQPSGHYPWMEGKAEEKAEAHLPNISHL
ncbi:hypothetical protein C922_04960 [Plasmodium inui San Antonio 1]|uniref:Uncharacterized protein n=1 Tax=Plasmodium inui San Antonio 1 TaxID=1237626 RepID=W7A6H9_9APIC|nr:hypothetical protein C922_04960 [Plasmodium inui San Antonio 1]EUD64704.1 hypothetical protein C922_04960 [Plasmodium inui San Antonio 1]